MSVINWCMIMCRRPRLSEPQSDPTHHSECCTSIKVTVYLSVWKVVVCCATCHVLAKISPVTFATFAAKWYLNCKGSHCQNTRGKLVNWILDVRSEMKLKSGRREFAAAHVLGLWHAGWKVHTNHCLLLFRWFGVSVETTPTTAVLAWLRTMVSHDFPSMK